MLSRILVCSTLLFSFLIPTIAAADEPVSLGEWGATGSGTGEWLSPTRFTVTPPDAFSPPRVMVVDRSTGRIQQFGEDGTFLAEWLPNQTGLVDPVAVAIAPGWTHVDGNDQVLVLDAGADAVLFFDFDGNLQRTLELPAFEDGDVDYGVAYSRIHVLLTDRHVLQIYEWNGAFVQNHGTFDSPGSAVDQLNSPRSLSVTPGADNSAIADTGNDRVVLVSGFDFASDVYGGPGSEPGQFAGPQGVAFDCRGRVLVADTGNDRVQRIATGLDEFVGLDEIWFAPPGGSLSEIVDLGYGLATATIVGKGTPSRRKRNLGGTDLFLLDVGTNTMRRYEGECCNSFTFDPPATATSAGGSLYITPAGTGPTLEQVGATVTVEVLDGCEEPIAGFPFQDIWLDDVGNGDISLCQGGSVADANTDADGITTISGPIAGGGATEQGLQVYISAVPIASEPLDIRVSSPDRNGDLMVDLADVGPFGVDFFAQVVTLRSDFNHDGALNLGDVGILAMHLGESCP